MSVVRSTICLLSEASKNLPFKGFHGNKMIHDKSIFPSNRNHRKGFLIVAATITNLKDQQKNCNNNLTNLKIHHNLQEDNCYQDYFHQKQQKQNFLIAAHNMNMNFPNEIIQRRHFSTSSSNHLDNRRTVVTHEITKNLTLFSDRPRNVDMDKKTLKLKEQTQRPLVVMLSWLLAAKKNLAKYANIYTELGFDVMTVEISPWQLLWPVKGSQIVARDVLKFLESNPLYTPIVVHGFSVGGYVWGEVMVHMAREPERYKPLIDKIVAQIWDSVADITEIPIGVPKAIFPRNQTLQKALRNYTVYHLKTFHEQATCHYIRSNQMFYSPIIKAPVLFLLSKNDPIGAERSNLRAKESMESIGIKCTWACWERSGHAQHYRFHRDEYVKYLFNHLEANVMDKIPQKKRIEA